MTLLEPWSALIAGGAGLGVLTLLYVLKLRRKAVRVGSTLLWDQALAEVEVNTPWKRLRIDWLYLLQAMAIAALAIAIGRPALGIGSARQRVIVVIDTSASMAATDADDSGKPRLTEAKRLAAEMIENLRRARGVEAAVVSFGADANVVRGFVREATSVLEGIESIHQTDEPGNLQAALEAVGALTAGDAVKEEADPVVAYIFTDGGFDEKLLNRPVGVSVRLVRVGPMPEARSTNTGIVSISAQRDDADPATVQAVVRLLNTATAERDVSLRVTLNDQPVGATTAHLPASGVQPVILPLSIREGGILTVRVMNDDVLASDNTASVVIDGAREPQVVVVGPGVNGQETDPLVANFAQSVSTRSRVIGLEQAGDGAVWSGVDLIVFDRVEPRAGRLPPVASVSLGAGLKAAGVTLSNPPASAAATDRVVSWKRDHPLMRDVVLDALVLKKPPVLVLPPRGLALAEGLHGPLVGFVEGSDGIGRVVCSFGAEQGGWGSDLSFVVFMGNAMDYLTLRGRAKAGKQTPAGEAITVRVPATTAELSVTDPDGTQRQVNTPVSADAQFKVVSIGRAELAGVYRVAGAAEGEDRVAVNVDSALETSVATADSLPLRGSDSSGLREVTSPSGRPREIWDWFVLGSLGLLAVEWLAYASRARR